MEEHQPLCVCAANSPTKSGTRTSQGESTENVRCCGIICWKKKISKQTQTHNSAEHQATDFNKEYQDFINEEEVKIIYHCELEEPLKLGQCVEICGTPKPSWLRYAVEFKCTNASGGDIGLHFNPRHDMRVIIRNSREKGSWKTEETVIPPGFSFPLDKRFSIIFFFAPKCFMIAINETHFCTFPYRIPLHKIRVVEVNGETNVHSVDYREMSQYPKASEAMWQMNVPTIDNFPENNRLRNPFIGHFWKGLSVSSQLEVHGKVNMLPESFSINLQEGAQMYPPPIIPLRLNPRFNTTISSNAVIRNAYIKGSWGQEEVSSGFSFQPGQPFILVIQLETDKFVIWMDKKLLGEFKYRTPPTSINTVCIEGDIVLYKVFTGSQIQRVSES